MPCNLCDFNQLPCRIARRNGGSNADRLVQSGHVNQRPVHVAGLHSPQGLTILPAHDKHVRWRLRQRIESSPSSRSGSMQTGHASCSRISLSPRSTRAHASRDIDLATGACSLLSGLLAVVLQPRRNRLLLSAAIAADEVTTGHVRHVVRDAQMARAVPLDAEPPIAAAVAALELRHTRVVVAANDARCRRGLGARVCRWEQLVAVVARLQLLDPRRRRRSLAQGGGCSATGD